MPQLTVRGITVEQMASISGGLVEEMAAVCKCGTDNFTIDCLAVTSVFGGKTTETYPFIEVAWFERGMQVRSRLAAVITKYVQGAGVPELEVAFKVYAPAGYYINGERCGEEE
ncbi:DUF1904 family protein [Paenibacillus sp. y28]|uniref:DUF1904 family protein n=1 Tax=Paenibacillus sp. y28 TaxID=3129110 RepID=UPI00301768B4